LSVTVEVTRTMAAQASQKNDGFLSTRAPGRFHAVTGEDDKVLKDSVIETMTKGR